MKTHAWSGGFPIFVRTNLTPLQKSQIILGQIFRNAILKRIKHEIIKLDKELPWFKALENIESTKKTYVRMCLRRKENIRRAPRIKLSTIHGSKGGEADNVMLLTDLTRKADVSYWSQRDEERRVFYVGMTRARNTLNIVRSQTDREFTEAF